MKENFPSANADREPYPVYAAKGMLTKIIYPTGGIDIITYEGNDVRVAIPQYQTYHEYNCNVTGTGWNTAVSKSTTFSIDKSQMIELDITCITANLANYDSLHMQSEVKVLGTSFSETFQATGSPGAHYIRYVNTSWPLSPGTYTLTYTAKGAAQTVSIKMKYYPVTHTSQSKNKIAGGVRVKRIMTGNPDENPLIKRYYYAKMDELDASSMSQVPTPVYDKNYIKSTAPEYNLCPYLAMYSGSMINLFNYGSGPISYGYVIESTGENFEGGAVQTKFYQGGDVESDLWWGTKILGTPMSNLSSPLNGKPSEEIVYKKPTGTGPLFPIKKTQYNYLLEDTRARTRLYGYTLNQRYITPLTPPGTPSLPCANNSSPSGNNPISNILNQYDGMRYYIDSWWGHLESQTETLYDENGTNPVTTTTNIYFDNEQHLQQTRLEVVNSKNETLKTVNTYPPDFAGNAVYDAMTAKNIISPLVTSKNYNGSSELSFDKINYSNVGNNNFSPISVEKSVKGNGLEVEGWIDYYDVNGNILQFTSKGGVISSIIWGYNYRYPVAQITGTSYAAAIAQLTGGNVTALQSMDGATLRTEINRIRTNISSAAVTTYTYKTMAGVSSITDANNKTNSYDYDSFNRLLTIKDQDGNVVKKNEYVYTTPNAAATLHVYFNAPFPKTYACQTCQAGYMPVSPVYEYVVPYGRYFSLVDQATADALAAADTNGQEYANINGKCINSVYATCTGVGYKLVNCECQLGTIVCDFTQNNGGGSYTITYHYHWSDGSNGPQITETITCVGIDKKLINCLCEAGQKICEGVTNNGGGSYTVTYHYKWSDNSISTPSTTETITCSGPDKKMIGCNCETGVKVYETSEYCGLSSENGCCPHMWLCTFRYKWSDNSVSQLYSECSPDSCMPMEEFENLEL